MFSNAEIALLEEAREVRYAREIMTWAKQHDPECADYAIEPLRSGWLFYGGPGHWWNRAVGLGLDGPVADSDLDRVVEFHVERGVPAPVLVSSYAHDSLYKGLDARGFVLRGLRHVFARALTAGDDLRAGWPHPLPEGLVTEVVDRDDSRAVHDYAEVASSGFRPPGTAMTAGMARFNRALAQHPEVTLFVVRDGGAIVASCGMSMDSEVATLWGASVLPQHRNRGIQAALMIMRMERARAHGCRVAMVQCTPGIATERNALRLGYAMVCARISMEKPL